MKATHDELKPCPYCGNKAGIAGEKNPQTNMVMFMAFCAGFTGCGASVRWYSISGEEAKAIAVKNWNARTP